MSRTPLEIFVGIWTDKVTAVDYFEVVNTQVDTDSLPDQWGSAVYQPQTRPDVTMGSTPWVEERGTFLVALFARSGTGSAVLDAAIAQMRAAYQGAALDGLVCESVDGPHEMPTEADGEWWSLVMTVNYYFQTRRDATGALYGDWSGFPETPETP